MQPDIRMVSWCWGYTNKNKYIKYVFPVICVYTYYVNMCMLMILVTQAYPGGRLKKTAPLRWELCVNIWKRAINATTQFYSNMSFDKVKGWRNVHNLVGGFNPIDKY